MTTAAGPIPLRTADSMDSETTFSIPTTTAATDLTGSGSGSGCLPSASVASFPQMPASSGELPPAAALAEMLPWDTGISQGGERQHQHQHRQKSSSSCSRGKSPEERGVKRFCNGLFKSRACRGGGGSTTSSISSASDPGKSVEELSKRSLEHFPAPMTLFPQPSLEFDFRIAVKLRPEPSHLHTRPAPSTTSPSTSPNTSADDAQNAAAAGAGAGAGTASQQREITAITSGCWSGSFGHGKVLAGGYDLGQARGFRPVRIVEGVFVIQTTDDTPAILEMRTRGSLSGPCDVLDALLSPSQTHKTIDPRRYGFRMFSTIKTADKRYAEIVNCGLWVASGVWRGDELIIDAYRVT